VDCLVATKQFFALQVLAVLGAQGSTHALDLLAGHLNDSHSTIRRWTLQAYQFTLAGRDKALAVSQLKAEVGR
jgi:hypothetical protein